MRNLALSAVLACASTACATSQPITQPPQQAASAAAAIHAAGPSSDATIAEGPAPVATSVARSQWLGAAAASKFVMAHHGDQFAGVWIDVPEAVDRAHVPMMITLTIDTSGSMANEKIVQARAAARTLVTQMHDGDIVALQTFSDTAHELVPATVLDAHSRMRVMGTIAELNADGSTNIEDGLSTALRTSRHAPSTHPVRRVVMISDGRATAGNTSAHVLGQIAEVGTRFGVQVTSLGVGLDYDEQTLNELAIRSSGRLYHLADEREMSGIVKGELKLLQSTMATNAVVEVVPAPGVQLVANGGAIRSEWGNGGTLRFPLGTVFGGQRRELLVRFRITDTAVEGPRPIASARLIFEDPTDGGVQRVQEAIVRAELTTDPTLVSMHGNPDVQAIIAIEQASTLAQHARADIDSDRFDQADAQLARAEQSLRENAAKAKDMRAKQRLLQTAAGMASTRRSVEHAKAAPAPMRAAAKRASSLDANDAAMEASGY